jgi:hypoxanthine phosphoribosyltransferase
MAEDAFGYKEHDPMASGNGRKRILIVDDINDQGTTINWIKQDWQSGCHPSDERWADEIWGNNVRFAVLTHNFSSHFKDPDYYVWTVNKAEEDCWLVYPWEDFWL